MEQKKPTKGDLERRMKNALVLVPKDKEYKSVFFDDKGLRLECTQDYACVKTNFHVHVFSAITMSGVSRPYLYVSNLIDIALSNDCIVKDSKGNDTRSYSKLINTLKDKENKTDYNIVVYTDWWLFNIFSPLYSIDENAASQFKTFMGYVHNIACNSIFLGEHKDGLTNVQFIENYKSIFEEMTKNITENAIFEPLSDEQMMQQEMEAIKQNETEQIMEAQANGEG